MKRATHKHLGQRRAFGGSPNLVLWLGALAFVLQLILAPIHVAAPDPASTAIAELSALTGEHLALCGGAADDRGSAPTHSSGHCGQCCRPGPQLAASLPPPILVAAIIGRPSLALALPAQSANGPQARYVTAQPRGPPSLI